MPERIVFVAAEYAAVWKSACTYGSFSWPSQSEMTRHVSPPSVVFAELNCPPM